MYIQEITININSTIAKDEITDEFGLLMSFYRGSGQTQGRVESQYINKSKIVCLPFTLEKNALDEIYNNYYVNKQRTKIEQLCNSKLTFETVGKTYDSYTGPCNCTKSDFYILHTNYKTIDSPITCGTCNKSIPLYRLPHYYDYGYKPILSWETNYISCDRLQMNCEVGERWALNQMQNLSSPLTKQGLEICRKIEALTQVPTYYYLHNYKKIKNAPSTRPCPSCSKKWNLKNQLHNYYDYKCDNCKIVSIISPNSE